MTEPVAPELATFLRTLELERTDENRFTADPGDGRRRLFGGLVAAQAYVAAARTVDDDRALHSLHAYFLRPGRHGEPIDLRVERTRDGGSFSSRLVGAAQRGGTIFTLAASFCRREDGFDYQEPGIEAPPPEGLPEREDRKRQVLGAERMDSAVHVRLCDPDGFSADDLQPPEQRMWMKPRGPLPDDDIVHTATLIYASDRGFISTASRPHPVAWHDTLSASLDHALWMHGRVRFDDWLLFWMQSPVARAAHALLHARVYSAAGVHVMSVAQEGLIRPRRR